MDKRGFALAALFAAMSLGLGAAPGPARADPPVYSQKELDRMRARITRYERREAEAQAAFDKATEAVDRALADIRAHRLADASAGQARDEAWRNLVALHRAREAARERLDQMHKTVVSLTERWIRESQRTRDQGEPAPVPQPKATRADTAAPPTTVRRERPSRQRGGPPSSPERSFEGGGISVGSGG